MVAPRFTRKAGRLPQEFQFARARHSAVFGISGPVVTFASGVTPALSGRQ
jgi:hypothetical protein